MKRSLFFALLFFTLGVQGQKFISESSKVTFFSKASVQDIAANNSKSTSTFNTATSEIEFMVPIKEFTFEKSLMQKHFNEKYIESEKYPKSTFQGKILDFQPQKSGPQLARAVGKFTVHGVTKDIDVPGTVEFVNGRIIMKSKFKVKLVDYKIEIPQLLWRNVTEEVEVSVDFTYKPN